WLNRCLNGHAGCHHEANGQSPLPTRAIWVGDTDDDVRLVNSEGLSAPYVCLSYKWGGYIPDCITKTESLQRNLTQLEWSKLPQLFQDVIHLTRALRIRYLWIDSVCIVQDDKSDWAKEGTQMAAYYGNAFITIAAVRAETPEESLFSQSAAQDVPHEIVPLNPQCIPGRVFVRLGKPHDNDWKALDRSTTPLLTRAWVYQERLLSARVLSFTATELVWECTEDTTCQCVLDNHTPGAPAHLVSKWHWPSIAHEEQTVYPKKVFSNLLLSTPTPSLQQRMHAWYNLVNQYSVLHLSYGTDKLMALSGIAKEMHRIRSSTRYLAGLWEDTLLPDLCWNSSNKGTSNNGTALKSGEYRAPSWSWAAVDHRFG
ncbi:heterokaryon incompatibility protein-domain-containing protein, partial [Paraphoma chrysanthemicola]